MEKRSQRVNIRIPWDVYTWYKNRAVPGITMSSLMAHALEQYMLHAESVRKAAEWQGIFDRLATALGSSAILDKAALGAAPRSGADS